MAYKQRDKRIDRKEKNILSQDQKVILVGIDPWPPFQTVHARSVQREIGMKPYIPMYTPHMYGLHFIGSTEDNYRYSASQPSF